MPALWFFAPVGGGAGVARVVDSSGMEQRRVVTFGETQPQGGGWMHFGEITTYTAANKTPTHKVIPQIDNRKGWTAGIVAIINGTSGTTVSHTFRFGMGLMLARGSAPRASIDLPLTPLRPSLGLKMAREGKEHSDAAAKCLQNRDQTGARDHLSKANRAYRKLYQARANQIKLEGLTYRFGRNRHRR